MSAPYVRPSERVAARRRRLFLWLPLLMVGALVTVVAGPMIIVFNSLDVAGAALMLGGLLGFALDVEK
ncbi:hypothetical protein [Arthrobacter glacialis]|uniref:hypothetical protein n=1 Tax=Arthrobacter glacialis TaxID=1664 RepID=UPI0010573676|nr:hypothetical protein [Arthrobacter glacialis]